MLIKLFNTGVKLYNGYNLVTSVFFNLIKTALILMLVVGSWFLSAYMHEADMLRELKETQSFNLLHGGTVIKSCVVEVK
jgi:hypothetical protein